MDDYVYQTAEQAGFDAPEGCEQWFYGASFGPLLPDRLNVSFLQMKAAERFPNHRALIFVVEHADEDDWVEDVVSRVHFLFAPVQEVYDWVSEQLNIIERDGILDEDLYWPLVDPVLQKLWEETSVPARMKLCSEAEIDPSHIFDEAVPPIVHDLIYRDISE